MATGHWLRPFQNRPARCPPAPMPPNSVSCFPCVPPLWATHQDPFQVPWPLCLLSGFAKFAPSLRLCLWREIQQNWHLDTAVITPNSSYASVPVTGGSPRVALPSDGNLEGRILPHSLRAATHEEGRPRTAVLAASSSLPVAPAWHQRSVPPPHPSSLQFWQGGPTQRSQVLPRGLWTGEEVEVRARRQGECGWDQDQSIQGQHDPAPALEGSCRMAGPPGRRETRV